MKQNKFIRDCGPFRVWSISQDMEGVRLEVYPAFPECGDMPQFDGSMHETGERIPWAINRLRGEGGGPGIFTAIALARIFEEWLNQFYDEKEIKRWHRTLEKALKEGKKTRRKWELERKGKKNA